MTLEERIALAKNDKRLVTDVLKQNAPEGNTVPRVPYAPVSVWHGYTNDEWKQMTDSERRTVIAQKQDALFNRSAEVAPAASSSGEAANRTFLERAGLTVSGGAKQFLGNKLDTYGAGYEATQGRRTADNNALRTQYESELAQTQKNLQYAKEDGDDLTVWKNAVDNAQRKLDAMGYVVDNKVQEKATDAARDLAYSVSQSGAQDTEKAKDGASAFGKFAIDAGTSMTQVGLDLAEKTVLGAMGVNPGMLPFATRAFGGGTQQARQDGASIDKQLLYGGAVAAKEVLTEKMFNVALPFAKAYGGGSFDGVVTKAIGKAVERFAKTPAGKTVLKSTLSLGASGLSEGLEEFIGDWMEWQMPKIYGGDVSTAEEQLSNAIYDFAVGAATGVVGGAADINTYRNENDTQPTKNAAEAIPTRDVNTADEAAESNNNPQNTPNALSPTAAEKTFAAKIDAGELTSKEIDRLVAGYDMKYRQQFEQETGVKIPENHVEARRVLQSIATAGEAKAIASRVSAGAYTRKDSISLCNTPANATRRADFEQQTGVTLPSGLREVEQTLNSMKPAEAPAQTAMAPANETQEVAAAAAPAAAAEHGKVTVKSKKAPTTRERRALAALSKKSGVNIVVQDNLGDLNGYYSPRTNTIFISAEAKNPVSAVAAHEIAHAMRQGNLNEWAELDKITRRALGEDAVSRMETILRDAGYKGDQISEELVSHYVQTVVTDIDAFEELAGVNRNLAQRIVDALDAFLRKLKKQGNIGDNAENEYLRAVMGHPSYGEAVNALEAMKKALSQTNSAASDNTIKQSIVVLPDGKKYVQADRQVISSDDTSTWEQAIISYVNTTVREGKDVTIPTSDGGIITITGRTAWKLGYRNGEKENKPISNEFYKAKGNAAGHIDELISVSDKKRHKPSFKAHTNGFASDGFDYRTAYFRDFDGAYYKMKISIGVNDNGKEAYNIGNIEKASFPVNGSKAIRKNASDTKIPQPALGVNSYSMQESQNDSKQLNLDRLKELADDRGAIPNGEKPTRDVVVPVQDDNGGKVMRGARTILESPHLNDAQADRFAEDIIHGKEGYEVIPNKKAQNHAETIIRERGYDEAAREWQYLSNSSMVPDKNTLVLGEYLMMEAFHAGETELGLRYAAEVSAAATRAGQTVQAMRLLKKLTPTGQLFYLNKTIEQMNHALRENGGPNPPTIKMNTEKAKKLIDCENITDPKAKTRKMQEVVGEIEQDIADQTPVTWWDKWNAWRYLAMLGNPRTQVRNVTGNAMFTPLIATKNLMANAVEKVVLRDPQQRTKAIVTPRDKATLKYADEDFDLIRDEIQGGGKYNEESSIQQKRRIFKFKPLEGYRVLTDKCMDKGDEIFSRAHYKAAFTGFMKSRGMTLDLLQSGTPAAEAALNNARNYAIKEAQKATFRDANTVAQALNRAKKWAERNMKNANDKSTKIAWGAANALLEGIIPFTKTPANIMVRGIEYSPLGILKGMKQAIFDVKAGRCTAADAIDSLCCGLTGTGIMALGLLGASLGLLNGSIGDDKEGKEEKLTGSQQFSLVLGDKSYTIDWMAPLSLPLFSGVALYDALSKGEEMSGTAVLDALSIISEPMFEMSMLQGLNKALSAGQYSSEAKFASFVFGAFSDYIGQANPTVLGQIARAVDPVSRNSYYYNPTTKGFAREAQVFLSRQIAKIPGLSTTLPARVDAWGREQKNEGYFDGVVGRLAYNMTSPGYASTINATPVDKEVSRLYKKLGRKSVIPSSTDKYFESNGTRYNLTADEYEKYAKWKGSTAYKQIEKAIASPYYKLLSDSEKADAIDKIYNYAEYTARKETKGISAAPTSGDYAFIPKANGAAQHGISPAKYITMYTDLRSNGDQNGSGSLNKEEIVAYLDHMALTRAQKAYLFSCWSTAKKNPYS